MIRALAAFAALALSACATAPSAMDATLRLNDLQALGTHNSYKQAIDPAEYALIAARNPLAARTLDYAHRPLTEQLNRGMRQIELDIVNDPEGGRFADPRGRHMVAPGTALQPFDPAPLRAPGFKVLHVQDIDYRSSCALFAQCLREIATWSAAHPRHAPILIMLNLKRGPSMAPGGVEALPFDDAAFDALDEEIRAAFPHLITPDEVQGTHATLREAVLAGGWPTLAASRGRVIFALDESDAIGQAYRGARRNLEGRALFINAPATSPVAAYMTINDPIADAARIREMVAQGFLVRTRADADTWEARRNDTRRRDAAFASGAQYVSTDYIDARPDFSDYVVTLPGGAIARCNPVRAPERCAGAAPEAR